MATPIALWKVNMLKRGLILLMLLVALVVAGCKAKETEPTATPEIETPVFEELPFAPDDTITYTYGDVNVALGLVKLPEGDLAATVNGEAISTARYQTELSRQLVAITEQYRVDWNDPENVALLPQFQDSILEQLIDQTLLPQLAAREGISVPDSEVEAEIAMLKAQMVDGERFRTWQDFLDYNGVTDEEVWRIISNSLLVGLLVEELGGSPEAEQVRAAHILVEEEETAREVLAKLEAGESFEALAQQYSIDTGSKAEGGDLGWFPRGAMVPEFEDVAFGLEVGETSNAFASQFGFHIGRVLGHEVRPMVGYHAESHQQEAFSGWYEAERLRADIVKNVQFDLTE